MIESIECIYKMIKNKRTGMKYIILVEMLLKDHFTLSSIADEFGITRQAVSDYFKELMSENLVINNNGIYKPGVKGIEFIRYHTESMKKGSEKILERIIPIDTLKAVADTDIKKGDKVSLFMSNGILRAYNYTDRISPSYGTAGDDASFGDIVNIISPQGIIDMKSGFIRIVRIKESTSVTKSDYEYILKDKNIVDSDKIIISGDIEGFALAMKLFGKVDTQFSPVDSAIEAAVRGIDVIFLGNEETCSLLVNEIESMPISTTYRLKYKIIQNI